MVQAHRDQDCLDQFHSCHVVGIVGANRKHDISIQQNRLGPFIRLQWSKGEAGHGFTADISPQNTLGGTGVERGICKGEWVQQGSKHPSWTSYAWWLTSPLTIPDEHCLRRFAAGCVPGRQPTPPTDQTHQGTPQTRCGFCVVLQCADGELRCRIGSGTSLETAANLAMERLCWWQQIARHQEAHYGLLYTFFGSIPNTPDPLTANGAPHPQTHAWMRQLSQDLRKLAESSEDDFFVHCSRPASMHPA